MLKIIKNHLEYWQQKRYMNYTHPGADLTCLQNRTGKYASLINQIFNKKTTNIFGRITGGYFGR